MTRTTRLTKEEQQAKAMVQETIDKLEQETGKKIPADLKEEWLGKDAIEQTVWYLTEYMHQGSGAEAKRHLIKNKQRLKRKMIEQHVIPPPLWGASLTAYKMGVRKYRNLDHENRRFYWLMHLYSKIMPMLGLHRGKISESKAAEFKENKMKMWREDVFPNIERFGSELGLDKRHDADFLEAFLGLPSFVYWTGLTIEELKVMQKVAQEELQERRRDLR